MTAAQREYVLTPAAPSGALRHGLRTPRARKLLEERQRLRDDLVHVVVLVRRQPSAEMNVRCPLRERLVLAVHRRVLRPRDGIVRVPLRAWILVDHARFWMFLAGQVLELRAACIRVLIGIIDNRRILVDRTVDRLEPELERTVRQLAEAEIEELVDR